MNRLLILSCSALLFAGCTGGRKSIYHWDGAYQSSVYNYLNEDGDINEQISDLQKYIKRIEDDPSKKVPPGLYAHLGLLYTAVGNETAAKANFAKEASLFPHSQKYSEFLLSDKKTKKGGKNGK